jgi:hypothetical protein
MWIWKDCKEQSYLCYFEPWSHCTEADFGAEQATALRDAQGDERVIYYDGGLDRYLVVSSPIILFMRCALCAVRCALCAVRCALCAVRCALCAVRCALCAVRCAVRCAHKTVVGVRKSLTVSSVNFI